MKRENERGKIQKPGGGEGKMGEVERRAKKDEGVEKEKSKRVRKAACEEGRNGGRGMDRG